MAVIEKFNSTRLKKPNPVFLSQAATKIIFYDVPSQIKEAQMIASIAKKSLPSKVLILIPHQGFSEPIKKTLRRWRINYDCRVNIEVRNQCVRYS
jgi:hypothetical protein